ncbi:hypothetical protein BDZ88DRAFT_441555 [Geranomyces variabilis]|nr:hypothetical protein BDZ88DRAFT_441555 [Geranomyces variabilis]
MSWFNCCTDAAAELACKSFCLVDRRGWGGEAWSLLWSRKGRQDGKMRRHQDQLVKHLTGHNEHRKARHEQKGKEPSNGQGKHDADSEPRHSDDEVSANLCAMLGLPESLHRYYYINRIAIDDEEAAALFLFKVRAYPHFCADDDPYDADEQDALRTRNTALLRVALADRGYQELIHLRVQDPDRGEYQGGWSGRFCEFVLYTAIATPNYVHLACLYGGVWAIDATRCIPMCSDLPFQTMGGLVTFKSVIINGWSKLPCPGGLGVSLTVQCRADRTWGVVGGSCRKFTSFNEHGEVARELVRAVGRLMSRWNAFRKLFFIRVPSFNRSFWCLVRDMAGYHDKATSSCSVPATLRRGSCSDVQPTPETEVDRLQNMARSPLAIRQL